MVKLGLRNNIQCGVMKGNTVEIIANDQVGDNSSYVAFTESERLIGDSAKNQCAINSENTIFDAKRLGTQIH